MHPILRSGALLSLAAVLALPAALGVPATAARAAGDGSTTVLVLDVSGSMDDPARIPPDFPKAAALKEKQDALGRLVEQAKPGNKVPLSVIAGGVMGLPDLISLRSELDDYLKQHNVDPASLSKLAALKAAAAAMLAAVQFERDRGGVDDRVGIVTFSDDAAVVAQVTPSVSGLAAAVQGLETQGSTNMGAGLTSALDLLKGQANPSVILLTDGWNNDGMTNDELLSGPVQRAAGEHVPVCTVGLGEAPGDVDQRLLRDIAGRTGGGYHFVSGDSPLGGDLLACHQSLTGQVLADQRGTVRQGQVAQGQGFTVPAGRHRLSITLSWPGSQMDLRVTDPAGKPVGAGYPGASVTRGAGVAVLTVTNPAAGHWGMSVAGVQTAAAGEPFVAVAATDGATTDAHRDAVLGSGEAALDQTQQRLLLIRNVTAVVAAAFLLLWLIGLVTRPFRRRGPRGGAAAPVTMVVPPGPGYPPPAAGYAPPPGQQVPGYPPPGGYTPAAPGYPPAGGYPPAPAYQAPAPQPVFVGAPTPPPAPPARRGSPAAGCLGCLGWLAFVTDVLILGASAAALYLWTTPLLTFPG